MNIAWFYLFIAGIFEIAWAVGMKFTEGFSRFWPTAGVLSAMLLSVYFLSLATRTLPIGTAYAVWTGIGIVGTTLLGMVIFGESATLIRMGLITLILLAVIGLRLLH
jgi:quaternary ammonium compound-resistance protein SugE